MFSRTMAEWNPDLYRRFEDERTRPARELLARVPLVDVRLAYDLGCGPGNSTELVVGRYPNARVIGTDTSDEMLKSARERLPACTFELSDIATWRPAEAPDLIFANASLQWVGEHETLIGRIFERLAPGGVLAFQMPDNRQEPTHRLMREVASLEPWSRFIDDAALVRTKILPLEAYYDLLANTASEVDAWRTAYQHRMDSPSSIVAWLQGTGLKPFIEPLPNAERASFLEEYERRIAAAYPKRSDGKLLLAFPRLFVVARKP
jgi:trans-aconitate 2-methyltransferase